MESLWPRPDPDLVAGALAGTAAVVSGHPFDSVKVRLQASRLHTSAMGCFSHIVRYEGAAALYRGLCPPLIGGAAETAINYAAYTRVLELLRDRDPDGVRRPYHTPLAAGAAGLLLSAVLSPVELVKCRLQVSGGRLRSTRQCVAELLRADGAAGLTRGLGATLAREVPGNALCFTAYETIRGWLPGRHRAPSNLREALQESVSAMAAGGLAGCIFWTAVFPVDVAKTRLQLSEAPHPRPGLVATLRRLAGAPGGVRNWYRGLTPTLARAFPANACQWLVWELATWWLKRDDADTEMEL